MFKFLGTRRSLLALYRKPPTSLRCRPLHIQTMSTPNENALKYLSKDGELFQPRGSKSISIKSTDYTLLDHSKLARTIFAQVPGVERILIGDDFLTVNRDPTYVWNEITPTIVEILTAHLGSGEDVVSPEFKSAVKLDEGGYDINVPKFEYDEDQQEVSDIIEDLIETRIRPAIMDDGGDILYRGWDPKTGAVYLKLQGACNSCASSEVTLKAGIEAMLKHYVEEVKEIVQVLDPEEQISMMEFNKLEKKLAQQKEPQAE